MPIVRIKRLPVNIESYQQYEIDVGGKSWKSSN